MNRGRGAGVTGLIDLSGLGAKFQADILKFQNSLAVQSIDRTGRGNTGWSRTRSINPGGTLICRGKVQKKGYPLPNRWRGQAGTIVLQLDEAVTQTVPIRVTSAIISHDEKSGDLWDISLTCEVTADPTFSGFGGTQPSATNPTPSTIETYSGSSKTQDPDGLQTQAIQRYDIEWFGLPDTDAAEGQLIADTIALSVVPLTGLKIRLATFNRTNLDGAVVTINRALTTTAEDIINDNTTTTIDPAGLTTTATRAAINAAPDAPTGPGTENLTETGSRTSELNDTHILYVKTYATRNSQQAVEQDGSSRLDDPNSLIDSAVVCSVTALATQPATPTSPITGLKYHHHIPKQLDNGHWAHSFIFDRRDTLDDVQMEGTFTTVDGSALEGDAAITLVNGTSTPPATPTSPDTAQKYVAYTSRQRHDTKWVHTFKYSTHTTEEQITLPGTRYQTDPNSLSSTEQITRVTDSATRPATPIPTLSDVKYTGGNSRKLRDNGAGSVKWVHDFEYGPRDSLDQVTQPHAVAVGTVDGAIQWKFADVLNGPSAYLQAVSEWSARKSSVNFEQVQTQVLRDGKILQVIIQSDSYSIVTFHSNQGPNYAYRGARISGSTVQVFLQDKQQLPGSKWRYKLGMVKVPLVTMWVGLRRKVSGGTLPMFWNLSGTCNATDFLGLSAKTVAFNGSDGQTNIAIAAPRVTPMHWMFYFDSNGFVDESSLVYGHWIYTSTDLSSPTVMSWVNASTLGLSVSALATGDYSVFL